MHEILSAVAESMPDEILSGENIERMAQRVGRLPESGLESTFGFESLLDEGAAGCDLFLSVRPNSEFSRYLINEGRSSDARPAQWGLARYLAQINDPQSPLSKFFATTILEYDLVTGSNVAKLDPGVFIEPNTEEGKPVDDPTMPSYATLHCGIDILTTSIALAVGREVDAVETAALASVAAALPDEGEFLHVGAMPSRLPRAVRLVMRMPSRNVLPFLQGVGWRGCAADLAEPVEVVRELQPTDRINIACDVSEGDIAARVGVEIYLRQAWADAHAGQWVGILAPLIERGWCNAEKAAALLSWPKRDVLVSERGVVVLLTGINHLKIVVGDARTHVKAYMGAYLFPQ